MAGRCIVSLNYLPPMAQDFPVTRISVVEKIRSADESERSRAIGLLCEAYWRPVYKYIRLRWQRDTAAAQDLTQGFFIEMLERELLQRFDAGKSRLRTYLRLCVDSFVMNEGKAASRQKRGGQIQHLALDFAGAEDELGNATIDPSAIASADSLDDFFEKEWIRSLFALAVEDLGKLCDERNRSQSFQLFEAYHLDGAEQLSYSQLAGRFGITVSAVTNALAWTRREFRRIALNRLREICGSDEEFQREARALFGQRHA
jgi:RNA polymerase sigma factor (sigma-70 family)